MMVLRLRTLVIWSLLSIDYVVCRCMEESNSSSFMLRCVNVTSATDPNGKLGHEGWPYRNILTIEKSYISKIRRETFPHTAYLHELYLNTINISEIIPGAFADFTILRKLFLSDNQLTTVPALTFNSLHFLNVLDLSNNRISKFEKSCFQNLTMLHNLYLQHNNIGEIEHFLFNDLINLFELNLSYNKISNFYYGIFDKLRYLYRLNVSGNEFMTLPTDFLHSLSNLHCLYFDDIYLSSLDFEELKKDLTKLSEISVHDNYWTCADLLKIKRALNKVNISLKQGTSFDVQNIGGVACFDSKNSTNSQSEWHPFFQSQKAILFRKNISLNDSTSNELTRLQPKHLNDKGTETNVENKTKPLVVTVLILLIIVIILLTSIVYFMIIIVRKINFNRALPFEMN